MYHDVSPTTRPEFLFFVPSSGHQSSLFLPFSSQLQLPLRSGFCVLLLFFLLSFSLSANSFGLLCIGLLMALLAILPWFLCFAFLRLCLIGTASFNEIGLMGSSDRALLVDV